MLPLRLVLDTNIVVSAALKSAGLQRTVLLLALKKPARLYVSAPVFAEYRAVLSRAELHIRRGLRQQFFQLLENRAHFVAPSGSLQVTSDPADNIFFECARRRPRRLLDHRQSAPFPKVLEENQSHQLPRIYRHRRASSALLNLRH